MIYMIHNRKQHYTKKRIYRHKNRHGWHHFSSNFIKHKGTGRHIHLQKLIRQKSQYICQIGESSEKGLDKNHNKRYGYRYYRRMGPRRYQHGQKQNKQNSHITPDNHQQIFLKKRHMIQTFPTAKTGLNDTVRSTCTIDTKNN